MKILFTGGGTGGHIFPIIAVAREIRKIYPSENFDFFFLGPKDDFSEILLSQEGIKVGSVFAAKIRRYFGFISVLQNILDLFLKFPLGFLQAFLKMFFIFPDVIFSKGGYGSFPVVLAGWVFGIPIFSHESDATPGLSNRILSRFAKKIFISFPETDYFSPKKMILTGNPVRLELVQRPKEALQNLLKLTNEKPILLILGGSQGAQRINDVILEILPDLLLNFEVIHQCGEKNFNEVKSEAGVMTKEDLKKYYHVFPFLKEEELAQAFAASNMVVSRAGSGSIFEIALVAKPSILIPLSEAAQNHQIKNAYNYANRGAAVVFEEANLTPRFFLEKLKYLISNPQELARISQKAKEFAKPEAAREIAQYILADWSTKHEA